MLTGRGIASLNSVKTDALMFKMEKMSFRTLGKWALFLL